MLSTSAGSTLPEVLVSHYDHMFVSQMEGCSTADGNRDWRSVLSNTFPRLVPMRRQRYDRQLKSIMLWWKGTAGQTLHSRFECSSACGLCSLQIDQRPWQRTFSSVERPPFGRTVCSKVGAARHRLLRQSFESGENDRRPDSRGSAKEENGGEQREGTDREESGEHGQDRFEPSISHLPELDVCPETDERN